MIDLKWPVRLAHPIANSPLILFMQPMLDLMINLAFATMGVPSWSYQAPR